MQAPATAIPRAQSFLVLGFGEVAPRGKTLRRVRQVDGRHPPLPPSTTHSSGANSAAVSRGQMRFIGACPQKSQTLQRATFKTGQSVRCVGIGTAAAGEGQWNRFTASGSGAALRPKPMDGRLVLEIYNSNVPRSIFLHLLTSGVYTTKPCEAGRRSTEHKGLRHRAPRGE